MANIYDKQIETMQRLINYGVNENTNNGKSVVEYHAEGADGKTYGIIRECNKYYIKVAPKKDTALVAEDYDYIGGFNNRKENEYSSYNVASKQFELKMKNLNEANQNNKKSTYQFRPVEASDWQINETKEMRAEINRFNDIMYNVNGILSEDKNFTTKHTLPEAPASNPSDEKVNGPFTDTAVANGDKDFKTTKSDYQKVGPFNQDGSVDDKDMQSTKNPTSSTNGDAYTEKPQYVETGVAGQEKKGGKVVKVNEAQVLAWSKSKDFMDKSDDTTIGSTAPFTCDVDGECKENKIEESEGSEFDEMDDETPFPEVEDDEFDGEEFGFEEDEYTEDIFPEDEVEGNEFDGEEFGFEDDEKGPFTLDDEKDDEAFLESKIYNMVKESLELNDFGKHPAYNKSPMTLPNTIEIELNGAKDWNDDSAKSSEPFGRKIGDSAPYSEDVIDDITDMVIARLIGKKKN